MSRRVLAKAGQVLGGDDVDHTLEELLERSGVSREEVGDAYWQLKPPARPPRSALSSTKRRKSACSTRYLPHLPHDLHPQPA